MEWLEAVLLVIFGGTLVWRILKLESRIASLELAEEQFDNLTRLLQREMDRLRNER